MADADFTMMEALMELCQEKHIDQLYLLDRLEAALAETYARVLKLDWGAKVTIDRTTASSPSTIPWMRRATSPSTRRSTSRPRT